MTGYRIISADDHVFEPPELWISRAGVNLRDQMPRIVRLDDGDWWYCKDRKVVGVAPGAHTGRRFDEPENLTQTDSFENVRPGAYLPEERLKDLWLTFALLLRMVWHGLHGVSVMVFAPYPGSQQYQELHAKGKLVFDGHYQYSTLLRSGASFRSYNPKYGVSFLLCVQWFFLLTFFSLQYLFRPLRFLRIITNLIKRKEETVMDQFLRVKLNQFRGILPKF